MTTMDDRSVAAPELPVTMREGLMLALLTSAVLWLGLATLLKLAV